MKRYRITAVLSDGTKVDAKVTARSKTDAVGRLMRNEEFRKNTGGLNVESFDITPIPIEPVDDTHYNVRTITNKPGWYVVEDTETGIRVEWKKGMYNKINRVLPTKEVSDAAAATTALRKIGEYLYGNFRELV